MLCYDCIGTYEIRMYNNAYIICYTYTYTLVGEGGNMSITTNLEYQQEQYD